MGVLKSIKHFLGIYTPEESYIRGKNVVDSYLKDAPKPDNVAQHLYNMSAGGFNLNEGHSRFDAGVRDRLEELGFYQDRFTI